jgi:hypothetical protein
MSSRARQIALVAIAITKRSVVAVSQTGRRSVVAVGRQAKFTVIAVIKWVRKLLTAGVSFGRFLGLCIVAAMFSKRMRLFAAIVLFVGWMSFLGYAALTKSHSPVVSHVQAAAATLAVVAEVEANQEGKPVMQAKVIESLTPGGPQPGTELHVLNLPDTRGFDGTGQYLLLLKHDSFFAQNIGNPQDPLPFVVVGQQRSPGNDLTGVGRSAIYRWNDDVRKQFEVLHH